MFRNLVSLWEKRIRVGKSSSLKLQIKEAESGLDATSVMLAREQAKIQAKKVLPNESPRSKNKLRTMVSGMLAERKSAWTSTTNITSKSVFGFLSATSIELQLLEICKAMGCSFENDETIKPKQYIGKNKILHIQCSSTLCNCRTCVQLQPSQMPDKVEINTKVEYHQLQCLY